MAARMIALAAEMRQVNTRIEHCKTSKIWLKDVATYLYHSHIAIPETRIARARALAEVFYNTASQSALPWYPAFLGGRCQSLSVRPMVGVAKHQLCWGEYDLGVGASRFYRQLVSFSQPDLATAWVVARSVDSGPLLPENASLAYTIGPNGELVYWRQGLLHWHHLCCTPGAGLFPGRLDRWLMNAVRFAGLDQLERKTYREEALAMCKWLQTEDSKLLLG